MSQRWHRLRRVIRWIAVASGAFMLVVLYGWRYGFSPLPHLLPRPGGTVDCLAPDAPPPPDNFWHHVRTLTVRTLTDPGRAPTGEASREYTLAQAGVVVRDGRRHDADLHFRSTEVTLRPEDRRVWLAERPDILAGLAAAASAPDRRPPTFLTAEDVMGFGLLTTAALWQVDAAAGSSNTRGAFQHLLEAWTLYTAVVPPVEFSEFFDERGSEEVNETVAKPFRRLALQGPALAREDVREVLARLATLAREAGRPEAAFTHAMGREAPRLQAARRPEWGRVGRAVRMAGMLVRQDAGRLVMDLIERVLGRRYGGEPNYQGVAHGIRPLTEVVLALQTLVARDVDFAAMEAACVSRTVAALEAGGLPDRSVAPPWLPDPVSSRTAWRRWFDRPAVWRLTEVLPDARAPLESWRQWQVYLESCRLTLALRAFHDQHDRWPDALEELVPGILEVLPRDPFGDGPFRYARTGTGWRFWSAGPEGRDPERDDEDALPQRVFRSTEAGVATPAEDSNQGSTRTPSRVR